MTLRELKAGQSATVMVVGGEGALRQHFLDMGIIPGIRVVLTKFAPMGDPLELNINGYELTLRLADAGRIQVEDIVEPGESDVDVTEQDQNAFIPHPGLGEGGK